LLSNMKLLCHAVFVGLLNMIHHEGAKDTKIGKLEFRNLTLWLALFFSLAHRNFRSAGTFHVVTKVTADTSSPPKTVAAGAPINGISTPD